MNTAGSAVFGLLQAGNEQGTHPVRRAAAWQPCSLSRMFAECQGGNAISVRRSHGAQFLANQTWMPSSYYGDIGNACAGVTGDGRARDIVVNTSGISVRRSTLVLFAGGLFGPSNETWSGPFYGDVYPYCPG